MTFRILLTGSRGWTDRPAILRGLCRAYTHCPDEDEPSVLIHGGAIGADTLAGKVWKSWTEVWGDELYVPAEVYMAKDFDTPLERNKHMVNLGADVCIAFAKKWSSGTGHCARLARAANIPVFDFGVPTAYKEIT
jgi:hypothetical protein